MTQITVIATADTDRELGFECDRMFQQSGIEDLAGLAYFLGEVVRGMGYFYVDDVVLVTKDGETSSYDYTGADLQ